MTTQGGATAFGWLIKTCESFGAYCLIGGLAVDCYLEPVYTLDADLVLIAGNPKAFPHSLNALTPESQLRIRFTTDEGYQPFLARAVEAEVLGFLVKTACLEDVTQGKVWAYSDPSRRYAKRKQDELDLIRLAEAYPALKSLYPRELV